jgi:hypothetical protein
MSVICLALLIFSLVERAVRLAMRPAVKLAGEWAGRDAKPTGQLIFGAVPRVRSIPADRHHGPHHPRIATPTQHEYWHYSTSTPSAAATKQINNDNESLHPTMRDGPASSRSVRH